MKVKSVLAALLGAVLLLCACSGTPPAFDASVAITVVSREDGSGTRTAFTELFGLLQNEDGEVIDTTTVEAVVVNNTAVMMNTVASNEYAIGYISFGSLNDTVKPLKIDGVSPTAENVLNGNYAIARPFLLVDNGSRSPVTQDFVNFILSREGQAIVSLGGYVPLQSTASYSGKKPAGRVVVVGSSSVSPLMEKLKEAYTALNPGAEVEVQQSDSSTGIASVLDGICDLGMASRALRESERNQGLVPTVIAMDGIAVITHNENPVTALSREDVQAIFSGQTTTWGNYA